MNGAFSPLKGFLTKIDYENVLNHMRLSDGSLWPIPIILAMIIIGIAIITKVIKIK